MNFQTKTFLTNKKKTAVGEYSQSVVNMLHFYSSFLQTVLDYNELWSEDLYTYQRVTPVLFESY
jgi:hypothetical protein